LEVVAYTAFEVLNQNFTGGVTVDNDAATVLTVDRATSDGTIIDLQKNGTSVGSISVSDGDRLNINSGSMGLKLFDDNMAILPTNGGGVNSDGTHDLGGSTVKFKNLYLSGGVYLGGTGSANKLDDYEEGTWLLKLYDGTTLGTNFDSGNYTKVGRMVHITCRATNVNTTGLTGTAEARITLPFAPSEAFAYSTVYIRTAADAGFDGLNRCVLDPSSSYMTIERDTSEVVMKIEDFDNVVTDIFFTAAYITA